VILTDRGRPRQDTDGPPPTPREVTPMMTTLLAWTGALLSCLLSVPQVVRTLKGNRLDGVAAGTYWIVLGNAFVWAIWSMLAGEYAAGVPSLVNGPAAVLILHRLYRRQPRTRAADREGPPGANGERPESSIERATGPSRDMQWPALVRWLYN
jgi:uncharacterized protein with PQ loop repeat